MQGIIKTPGAPFEAPRKQEIDGLIAKGVFKFVKFDENAPPSRTKISASNPS